MQTAVIRRGAVIAVLIFVICLSGDPVNSSETAAFIRPNGYVNTGDPVPNFIAKGIFGERLDFAELIKSDKKIVLAFWSMYCQACLEKFNAMIAIQDKYNDAGLLVVSINTDGEYKRGEQSIRDFIGAYEKEKGVKVNFPVLYDETNWLALAMNISFLPTIITVGPEGRVRAIYKRFNERSDAEILAGVDAIVRQLLAVGDAAGEAGGRIP